jgi:AraC-like DNA-binding protein
LAAIRTTRGRSGPVTSAQAAHGLEQQLIHLLVECLSVKPASMAASTMQRSSQVMARFEELIRSHPESNLSVARISSALDVSDRLLRKSCEEHLGMTPTGYVRLHRLQLAHQALRQGAPQAVRVADVAKCFGFGNLGRFAGAYRNLYGELPIETLRRGSRRGVPDIALHKQLADADLRNFD